MVKEFWQAFLPWSPSRSHPPTDTNFQGEFCSLPTPEIQEPSNIVGGAFENLKSAVTLLCAEAFELTRHPNPAACKCPAFAFCPDCPANARGLFDFRLSTSSVIPSNESFRQMRSNGRKVTLYQSLPHPGCV